MKTPCGKTGTTTPKGKRIASQNAAKHHCTSTQLIVKGEDPAEFAALLASLTAEYQPETEMQKSTVLQAARATWDLARINREFDKSQQKLYSQQPHMHEWNAVQQAEFERMLRYRTKAEREHDRSLHQVEFLRKLRLQAEQRAFWENLQTERLTLSKKRLRLSTNRAEKVSAPKEKEKTVSIPWPAAIVHLSQIVEVRLFDGTPSITVHPQLEGMHQDADSSVPGTRVIRRFEFPDGIPAEYAWINAPGIARSGITFEQQFETVQAWRDHVAIEAAAGADCYLPRRRAT